MLSRLHIENFVTIEDVTIDFFDGLSILTGETGAGKSLMIDSLSLLLGERASLDMIRQGKDKAIIEGVFKDDNPYLKAYLNNLGIYDTDKIVIRRTISETKSSAKINDVNVSISDLKTVGSFLADIHLQFEVTKIFDEDNYLNIIDGFKKDLVDDYLMRYQESKKELINQKKTYDELVAKRDEVEKNRNDLNDELKELELYPLHEGYEDELNNKISLLLNYDKIYELSEKIKALSEGSSLDDLYEIKSALTSLSEYQNEYKLEADRFDELYIEIGDLIHDVKRRFNDLEYNPNELASLEEELGDLKQLKRKYKLDEVGLINRKEELKKLLLNKEDFDVLINDEYKKYQDLFKKTYEIALDLSKIRNEIAKVTEKEMMNHLKDLGLNTLFKIEIKTTPFIEDLSILKDDGIDEVIFFIETNIGEGLKPLAKVVSGGEASRIMLALKIIYLKSKKIKTIIFDEVDVGISGKIANLVAKKLYELSIDNQVIAISHLPQVARNAKTHYRISKITKDNRTRTLIKELSFDEKIEEIASLISDGKVTEKQLEYARELLTNREI